MHMSDAIIGLQNSVTVTRWVGDVCDHLRDALGLPHLASNTVPEEQVTRTQDAIHIHACMSMKIYDHLYYRRRRWRKEGK